MVERVESWTAEELTSAMDQLHGLSMATWRELLAQVAAYDRAEAWRADGMVSMADWLVARYGLLRRTANDWVAAAHALEDLPDIAQAVAAGRLSVDQTRAVVRMATPDNQGELAHGAVGRSAGGPDAAAPAVSTPTTSSGSPGAGAP